MVIVILPSGFGTSVTLHTKRTLNTGDHCILSTVLFRRVHKLKYQFEHVTTLSTWQQRSRKSGTNKKSTQELKFQTQREGTSPAVGCVSLMNLELAPYIDSCISCSICYIINSKNVGESLLDTPFRLNVGGYKVTDPNGSLSAGVPVFYEMLAGNSPFDIGVNRDDMPDQSTEDYLFEGRPEGGGLAGSVGMISCDVVCCSIILSFWPETVIAQGLVPQGPSQNRKACFILMLQRHT